MGQVTARPAESGGVAGALALLLAHLAGVNDPATIVALGVVIGFVPAAITWAVSLRALRTRSTPGTNGHRRAPAPTDALPGHSAEPPPAPEGP